MTGSNYVATSNKHARLGCPGSVYYLDKSLETVKDVGGGWKADVVNGVHQVKVCEGMWEDGRWENVVQRVKRCVISGTV